MLDSIRRWLGGSSPDKWPDAVQWAHDQGYDHRRSKDGQGFVIDCTVPGGAWRLEWGPSQRPYIAGQELRLRAEVAPSVPLAMLLMSRQLMDALEKQIFEQFTEGLQTRVDTEAPEEARWLVLHPKLGPSDLGTLRDRFGAAGQPPEAVAQWLEGRMAAAWADDAAAPMPPERPIVLILQRGRLTLRTPLADPTPAELQAWVARFRAAAREARQVAADWARRLEPQSTQPAAMPKLPGSPLSERDGAAPEAGSTQA